jgi:hypothetical protein
MSILSRFLPTGNPASKLTTDSVEYEILQQAAGMIKGVGGLCVEIGTRRGGSAKIIIDSLVTGQDFGRTLVCMDPYGNIFYKAREGNEIRIDYTNKMRNETQAHLHAYALDKPVNVFLLVLEDVEYMKRFADGYPVYDEQKKLLTEYAFVFFDGPHDVESINREIDFFSGRSVRGTIFVFDDINYYPHDEMIEPVLFDRGFELLRKGEVKASYRRVR